ncbi:amidophosphoribosyltransferase [Apilactobacillus apisilvae]|uniref:Amidophosphoribosyltransferase n=1 Tax=Apilactobacillus apisilvae TaxID=2923364 RepID=A0ABY4PIA6_9LACO|nr:amidophosphoribosyltransferase [Apilactobacillus apisilvae]UQS85390.1 amidophosphoribosyltransferase [Apilactobacillus apisilvae]
MLHEVKSLNEECGIFGIWNANNAAEYAYFGMHSLQHRGQEGAGIVSFDDKNIYMHKGEGLLSKIFADKNNLNKLTGRSAIGHIRYATAGSHGLQNIQPFFFNDPRMPFAISHNGNLTNAKSLRDDLTDNGAHFQADSDSELLGSLMMLDQHESFIDRLKVSLKKLHGGFAFIIMTPKGMLGVADPHGLRPIVLGKTKAGSYILCSETCALDAVNAQYVRDVQPGELVHIDNNDYKIDHYTPSQGLSICSLEYIYFARSDSIIHGVSVHSARKKMGIQVAKEHPVKADVVIGVPNSSLDAALGYAEASGIPFDMGMIKNQYVARTFIEPTQDKRELGVSMKLAAVKSVVSGKDIVLVDDSIVRGTTSKYIVQLLKEAGAKSIHVRIASPVIKYPCFYGVDIESKTELIGANQSVAEIKNTIGADSLGYLSVDGLIKSINLNCNNKYHGLCTAYFDGQYPTDLDDYKAKYDEETEQIKAHKGAEQFVR